MRMKWLGLVRVLTYDICPKLKEEGQKYHTSYNCEKSGQREHARIELA